MGEQLRPKGLLGVFERGTRSAICVIVFLAAFTVTHLPPPKAPFPPLVHDKILHLIGFSGLSFFLFWRHAASPTAHTLRFVLGWYGFLLAYAAFDEITQPLTGRSCELGDWMSDAGGAVVGTAIVLLWHRWAIRGSRSAVERER